ncbi:inositol monophosphatase family protein [Quadrisphaera sp. DSM 44207]|uniref:inositol monophosphatase family protein n=1 Tax=Quadrisphaera sp. DSM 44207 TaxID=1881057 RepID=UPI00088E19A5|nr:inositol monophosphatase family protein [Quadrisphaera sp. DSM 44207]SDQ39076.1 myo-inositol-1(or 4)-monophosphatase [Quadrisphaera sp. DSM 44207]
MSAAEGTPASAAGADDEVLQALAFAGDLVTRSGHEAARRQVGVVEQRKPAAALTGSVVTEVDLDVELAVDAALRERYPHDGLVGEERVDRAGTSGRTWVVDPVDGTLNYARRLGPWSVVLSAWRGDACELVAVWTGGVLYTAARGRGAHRDGERLQLPATEVEAGGIVRVPAALVPAVVRAGWLPKIVESSAAEVASVADGRVVGSVRLRGERRDLHGPALLVAEAGGTVTAPDGGPWDGATRGLVLAAPGAHAALLDLVPAQAVPSAD